MVAVLNFDGFRWRNDDGSESAATWKAAENVNPDSNELLIGAIYRCRVVVSNTGDVDSGLQNTYFRYQSNGGGYIRYGTTGDILLYTSSFYSHGQEPTNQMTSGQGTFGGGEMSNGNNFTPNENTVAGTFDEFEFIFQVNPAATPGTLIDFKHNAGSSNPGVDWDLYNVTIPQFTLVSSLGGAARAEFQQRIRMGIGIGV